MSTPSPDQQPSEEPKALTLGFRLVLLSSALYIAGCSAYFSVLGLGQLFTGSEGPVMIMAASLEVGKLVAASFLYRYWHLITGVLRFYLTLAVLVLIAITSLGNYGYLARAYEKTATTIARNETEIATLEKTIADSQRQIDDARGKTVRVNTASREDIAKLQGRISQAGETLAQSLARLQEQRKASTPAAPRTAPPRPSAPPSSVRPSPRASRPRKPPSPRQSRPKRPPSPASTTASRSSTRPSPRTPPRARPAPT